MASDKQATLLANLTRERFMLEAVAKVTGLRDHEDLHAEALDLDSGAASDAITRLRAEIKSLRDQRPITRWVDADPQWRDATGSRMNNHRATRGLGGHISGPTPSAAAVAKQRRMPVRHHQWSPDLD
ncbi:hypothetical protein [Gordonia soli]|uniref:Uncharacterized protein n=1 Tax=Gordonia soli NBRC 108243 TaxID=1223545 RepID=M0QQI3_9ACTN|nr:hypothetical protein [Gordonia soli]GAC70659.1 hypothetical protein GS4_38_00660 [Gordonia soli NBRC 108243]